MSFTWWVGSTMAEVSMRRLLKPTWWPCCPAASLHLCTAGWMPAWAYQRTITATEFLTMKMMTVKELRTMRTLTQSLRDLLLLALVTLPPVTQSYSYLPPLPTSLQIREGLLWGGGGRRKEAHKLQAWPANLWFFILPLKTTISAASQLPAQYLKSHVGKNSQIIS